jgi:hypothetical protein
MLRFTGEAFLDGGAKGDGTKTRKRVGRFSLQQTCQVSHSPIALVSMFKRAQLLSLTGVLEIGFHRGVIAFSRPACRR